MKNLKITLPSFMLGMGALLGLTLMIVRLFAIFSFIEPRHVVTSGFEEESLYAIWKYCHHLKVYQDPHQIPFAASYFNWLFYEIYGSWTAFWIKHFHLPEVYIPTIARALTLCVTVFAAVFTYRFLRQKEIGQSTLLALILSVLLWGSPLIGFWAMTVRPDVLGLCFDVMAALFFLKYFDKRIGVALFFAAIGCYLSWSVKQVNIAMPLAIGLFLLGHKRYAAWAVFSISLLSLYGITLFFAPPSMLKMVFFVKTAVPFSWTVFIENFSKFFSKTLALWLLVISALFISFQNQSFRSALFQNKAWQLGMAGVIAWGLTLLPLSSKVGSSDNYHFICLFFSILLVSALLKENRSSKGLLTSCQCFSGLLLSLSLLYVLQDGRLNHFEKQNAEFIALKSCLETLPRPFFCAHHYGALPWMSQEEPAYVLAYNYWLDRKEGIPFEQNGIGGLISKGYFKALVLPSKVESYDGASLKAYQLDKSEQCAGFTIYCLGDTTG